MHIENKRAADCLTHVLKNGKGFDTFSVFYLKRLYFHSITAGSERNVTRHSLKPSLKLSGHRSSVDLFYFCSCKNSPAEILCAAALADEYANFRLHPLRASVHANCSHR